MNHNSSQTTEPHERVPFSRKVAWSLTGINESLGQTAIMTMIFPVFNIGLGLSPILVGYALAVSRIVDAVTDPIIGNLSDNARTRFGRRKPFILTGALLMLVTYTAIWMVPPHWSSAGKLAWLAISCCAYITAFTIFSIPATAMGYEMTSDATERTRLIATRAFVSIFSQLIPPWLYWFMLQPMFGGNEVEGSRWVGFILGLIFVLCAIPAVLFGRENPQGATQPPIKILKSIGLCLESAPFRVLLVYMLFLIAGMGSVYSFPQYLNIYYVFGGDKVAATALLGMIGTVYAFAGMAATPLIAFLATHFGKRNVLIGGLLLTCVGLISTWWLYRPDSPWLQLIPAAAISAGLSCAWVLNGAFIGDICDADEVETGLRREGIFVAMFGFIHKSSGSLVVVGSGFLLAWSGITEGVVDPSPEAILRMRIIYPAVATSLILTAIGAMLFYPLNEARVHENQRFLAKRRGRIQSSGDS